MAPVDARAALSAPLVPLWGAALERLSEFVERPETPVIPTIQALEAARLKAGTVLAGPGRTGSGVTPVTSTRTTRAGELEKRIERS